VKGEKRQRTKMRRVNNELAIELTTINNWPAPGWIKRTDPGFKGKFK